MDILQQFIAKTPWYVWVIFVWVLMRGIKARQPGETTLSKMATIPLIFTAWGLYDLYSIYGLSIDAALLWLAGIVVGSVMGLWLIGRFNITVDRARGVFHRPADMSLLLATFAIKYTFGVIGAMSPQLLAEPPFRISDLVLSGMFTGIFVGKFLGYLRLWRVAQQSATTPAA